MGNGICNCSGPAKRGQEDLLADEARHKSSKQPSSSSSLSKESIHNEECNEAPIKQNKKIENKTPKKMKDEDPDDLIHIIPNGNDNNNNPDEPTDYDYIMNSSHNITKIMDADAAKAHHDDDDDDEEEDESLSDLSDGFDANGITIDMKPQKKKSEHKDLLRFRSKAKWDPGALDDHEKDMLAEMRRLSVSRGTGP
mmetsp:Transcript_37870/g.33456  ORF Transcript_37870/g.33456 Transcript_37870/m.33456 type:complete len:196 (-) Transcript_37870:136-723(-)|eukprot:CAMPEP_0201575162 /NCGR_PEP_ID=MMETSP0190_2-20130828/20188_1 /ASSEMBLY_ACC=CAM_ASM_000263 /TAXON_ID=37353 /ORGANISM="Rosalina sp." /LENGTH=195 /DNA_ID=CAMNT_0048004439 /DNA_START=98 /DNA_END=685 /DNA_ORIENTATION=-